MMRKMPVALLSGLCLCRAAAVFACTSWVVMPDKSASGRMLVHKCRDQHLSALTAAMKSSGGVRWMCIGANGGPRFSLSGRGVAVTSNAGGRFRGKRKKPPKHTGGIFEAVSEQARDAEAAAKLVRACGRSGWRHKGGLYLVADARRAFTVEIASGYGQMAEIPAGGTYVISNSMHLGGCEAGSDASKLVSHRVREAKTRAELHRNRENGKYPVTGVFKTSRLTGSQVPFGRFALSAVCFELDGEFPEMLGCAYIALGPQQHTVYLPTPMALEQFPKDLQNGKWAARALALRVKVGDDHRYLPRIEALEKEFVAEFAAAREKALALLRAGERDEAKKLLNATYLDHYARAKALLRDIAAEAGVEPDPPILRRKDENRYFELIQKKNRGKRRDHE